MTDIQSFRKNIASWENFQQVNKGVALLSYNFTGQSTLCEMIKKYQYGKPSENFIFENKQGRYSLEDIIQHKSIKMQTTSPVVYQKNINNPNDIKIIDVPSSCLSPFETKKWNALEYKINSHAFYQKCGELSFMLLIPESKTTGKSEFWRKTMTSFLQNFKEHTDDLMNSVGLIITKAPVESKEESFKKRLSSLKEMIQKQKNTDMNSILLRLIDRILERNAIFIFKKVSGNQEDQKQQIRTLYQKITEITRYQINPHHLKQFHVLPEEQKIINQYFELADSVICNLDQFLKMVLSKHAQFTQIQAGKREFLKFKEEISFAPSTKKKLNLKSLRNLTELTFVNLYFFMKEKIHPIEQNQNLIVQSKCIDVLNQIVIKFIESGVFEDIDNDIYSIEVLFGYIKLKKMIKNENIGNINELLGIFQDLFNNENQRLIQKTLCNSFIEQMDKQFYQSIISLVKKYFSVKKNEEIIKLLNKCQFQMIKYQNPETSLKELGKMYEENLKNKNKAVLPQIIRLIGDILEGKQYYELAALVFERNFFYEALNCYEQFAKEKNFEPKVFQDYMNFLCKLGLFAEAKRCCYQIFSIASSTANERRKSIGDALNIIIESQKKHYSSNSVGDNILLKEPDFNEIKKNVDKAITLGLERLAKA